MRVNLNYDDVPDLITATEVADLLSVSKDTVYNAVRMGQLRAAKLRGRVIVTKDALRTFLQGVPIQAE